MAELHTCTCDRTDGIDGCAAVAYRDVCRFEQALADPVGAQLAAAARAAASYFPGEDCTRLEAMAREMLAAAAIVVLGRPPCTSCGRPLGTGTLLDFKPSPPRLDRPDGYVGPRPEYATVEKHVVGVTIPRSLWEEFAGRYRCPACALPEQQDAPL